MKASSIGKALLGLAGLLALLYVGEDIAVSRAAASGAAFDTVEVQAYDAIPQKGNRVQFIPRQSQAETCVRALAPHLGRPPCWYLRSHARQRVDD